ncbi:MAG: hypothetical protein MUC63_07255, partial [Planctomycetes bacterium]|nr:hypothetical protein [Planctomycetota bacterium]
LVMGGSQGAKGINDLMAGAAGALAGFPGLRLVHLAGRDAEGVRAAYGRAGLPGAEVLAFDPDVGRHLRSADLVVSRAGAMATSEILAFGRPALFIPYPFAGGHQRDNAEPLARRRAAWLREESALTGESLGTLLRGLLADREGLRRTGERAKAQAAPRASAEVFERIRAAVSRRA